MSESSALPRLDDISTFVRVVDAGSFSAAANSLYVPRSSVSRQVARLERQLGVRLLQRTTRTNHLTEAGQQLYARVSGALAEIEKAASRATADESAPLGTVRLSAPPDVGAELLPRLLGEFVNAFPTVNVEVELSSGFPDLVRSGLDLAITNGKSDDASTKATKLQDTTFGLYASTSYLRSAPSLETITDLANHECVLFHGRNGRAQWEVRSETVGRQSIGVRGRISASDMAFIRRACIEGAGVAMLPTLVGDAEGAAGTLQRILPDVSTVGIPLFIVRPATRFVPRRTEVLEQFLLREFPQ